MPVLDLPPTAPSAPARSVRLVGDRGVMLRLSAVAALLLLAVWLRLGHGLAVEFSDDQSWALILASDLLQGQGDPLRGPVSTTGSAHPPHLAFLLALPVVFSSDPWIAAWAGTAFVGLLSVLMVVLAFRAVELLFGTPPALAAALLLATNPSAVAFGRKIWGPTSAQGFAALSLFALLRFVTRGAGGWFALSALASLTATMLHPSNAYFLPVVGVIGLVRLREIGLRWMLATGLVGIVLLAPLAVRESRGSSAYVEGVFRTASGAATTGIDGSAFERIIALAGGEAYVRLTGTGIGPEWSRFGLDTVGMTIAAIVLTGSAALILLAVRAARGRDWRRALAYVVALLWIAWPGVFNVRHSGELQLHWFLGVFPGFAIATGALASVARARGRVPGGAASIVVAGITLLQLVAWHQHLGVVLADGARASFGVPLAYSLSAARLAAERAGGEPVLVANSDGMNSVFSYLGRSRFLVRRFDNRHSWVWPAEWRGVYVTEVTTWTSAVEAPVETVRTPSGQPVYVILQGPMQLGPMQLLQARGDQVKRQPLSATIAETARYVEAAYPRRVLPGREAMITARWQITRQPAGLPGELHEFAHLVDDRGDRISGEDYRGFPVEHWSSGDAVISTFRIPVPASAPAGRYWVDLGMYDPNTLQRLSVAVEGSSPGTTVRLGPIGVRPETATVAAPARRSGFRLDQFTDLEGYDVESAGLALRVRLVWRARASLDEDLTVFVHAVDHEGRLIGQSDSQPAAGKAPTSTWLPGDLIEDVHVLQLTPEASGPPRLLVGMYRLPSVQRLQVFDPTGKPVGDSVDLGLPK